MLSSFLHWRVPALTIQSKAETEVGTKSFFSFTNIYIFFSVAFRSLLVDIMFLFLIYLRNSRFHTRIMRQNTAALTVLPVHIGRKHKILRQIFRKLEPKLLSEKWKSANFPTETFKEIVMISEQSKGQIISEAMFLGFKSPKKKTIFKINKIMVRGHSITKYVDKMRGGGGQKCLYC